MFPTRPPAVSSSTHGAWTLEPEPGLRIPNMFDAALDGSFKGVYCQGEDIVQSDPNTQHVAAALPRWRFIIVQDIFMNETANYRACVPAGLILPGKGWHFHQCGAAHFAGAQGDAAQGRL